MTIRSFLFLQFRNIILKYAPSLPPALDGVSFKLPHAAKVGVVGRTGSGKSTLLVALFRLIQPCDGTIVLNGRDTLVCWLPVQLAAASVSLLLLMLVCLPCLMLAQTADLDALRNQLSIVPQEPAMFSGTLRENIDPFFRYSDAAVAKAVQECGLEGRSLDAVVGVSGENFSLGEKQLVCSSRPLRRSSSCACSSCSQ
jgi:ABC-type multidrug transport system fused ATPase/permease subunit